MKLRLDEHLSRRLVPSLQSVFPGSDHVNLHGLKRSTEAQRHKSNRVCWRNAPSTTQHTDKSLARLVAVHIKVGVDAEHVFDAKSGCGFRD